MWLTGIPEKAKNGGSLCATWWAIGSLILSHDSRNIPIDRLF